MSRCLQCCCLLLLFARSSAAAVGPGTPALGWIQTVLNRWDETCRRHLNLPPEPLSWIVFYDDRHAWHVNPETKLLPPHRRLTASVRFAGRKHPLFEVENSGGVWLPGGELLPVKAEACTESYDDHRRVYVRIALPALWQKERSDHSLMPAEHLYSLALHELTHTRQMVTLMSQMRRLMPQYHLPAGMNDDMVESAFKNNDEYRRLYEREKAQINRAILAPDIDSCREAAAVVVEMVRERQRLFFRGEYDGWAVIEGIFLALEGSAMWVQAQMALDHAPAGQDWKETPDLAGSVLRDVVAGRRHGAVSSDRSPGARVESSILRGRNSLAIRHAGGGGRQALYREAGRYAARSSLAVWNSKESA